MSDIEDQTILIKETISQLESGLEKTFIHLPKADFYSNKHIRLTDRLEVVCRLQGMKVDAKKVIDSFNNKWLVVEVLGK